MPTRLGKDARNALNEESGSRRKNTGNRNGREYVNIVIPLLRPVKLAVDASIGAGKDTRTLPAIISLLWVVVVVVHREKGASAEKRKRND